MCIVEEMSETFQMLSSDLPNRGHHFTPNSDEILKRDDFIQNIEAHFENHPNNPYCLYGPSGSGKSTLALDYAWEQLAKNKNLVSRWIQCDTYENLYANFTQKLLNIFFSHDLKNFLQNKNKSAIIDILCDKLKNLENEFLFIFVNLKLEKTHLKELFGMIRAKIPPNVKILVTSKNKIESLDCLEIKLFGFKDASKFVNIYLADDEKQNIDFNSNEENQNNQDYLPLNVLKMISYAKHFGLKIGFNQLEIFGGPIRRIMDDLFINFEHDRHIITYMAYLDGHFIQKDLIQSLTNLSDNLLIESINRLEKLFLIKSSDYNEYDNFGFSVHPEIHSIIRQFVEEKTEKNFKTLVYSNLIEKFYGEIKVDMELDTMYDSKAIDKLRHIKKFLKVFKNFENNSEQTQFKLAQINIYLAQLYENIFINHEYALKYYLKAVEFFKKETENKHNNFFAETLHNVGRCYINLKKNVEAIEYLNEALTIKYEIYDQFNLSISDTYKQMSIVYENLKDLKKSNTYLDLMFEVYAKNYDDDEEIIAETLLKIANNYKQINEFNQAITYYKRALDAYKIIHEENPVNEKIGTILKQIGFCCIPLRDFVISNDYLNQSIRILYKLKKYEQIGHILNTVGVNLQQIGDYFNSTDYLAKAIYLYTVYPSDELKSEFALVFVNIANNYRFTGDFKKSTECLNQALNLYSQILNESISDNKKDAKILAQSNLADTFSHIGINHLNLKDFKKALEFFNKAHEIYINIFDESHISIAQVCSNLGATFQLIGEYEKSVEFLSKSLEIFKKIHSNDPTHLSIQTCTDNLEESKRLLHWKRNYAMSIIVTPIKSVMNFLSKALHILTAQVPNHF